MSALIAAKKITDFFMVAFRCELLQAEEYHVSRWDLEFAKQRFAERDRDIAEVSVNGKPAGLVWMLPCRVDLTAA